MRGSAYGLGGYAILAAFSIWYLWRGGFAAIFACLKSHYSAEKIFYDLRLDLRFVWYNGCELGDGH